MAYFKLLHLPVPFGTENDLEGLWKETVMAYFKLLHLFVCFETENDLERFWKVVVVAYFNVLIQHLPFGN